MTFAKPIILVYHPREAEAYADCIRRHGFDHVHAASTKEEAEKYLFNTEVILGWRFPTELLSQTIASRVRWFQSTGAGVDDLVSDRTIPDHITLTRIVDQFGTYISEYVFTYLLYIAKDVPRMIRAQQQKRWDPFISETLNGKTIGVAGIGSIGAEIVRKARAFDMKVHGLSLSGKNAGLVDRHFTQKEWKNFVKELDYLVLTLPLTGQTRHVITRDLLLSMKPDACLANVGRGALINEEDLLAVMQSGHLRAAILDVFETEPLPRDHDFFSMPNVYVTSHLSGPSTVEGVCKFFIENLKRYIEGQPLNGIVDRIRGY
jgi:glyoxylate/hydroxypyruvate reductase A